VQGVCRLRKVSVVNLSEALKDYCCRCAQSRKNSTLGSVRGLSQGVCARVFSKTQNCVKLRKEKAFKLVEEKHRESCRGVFE
jgi:hypothetical protein